jgi:hypothetical protein
MVMDIVSWVNHSVSENRGKEPQKGAQFLKEATLPLSCPLFLTLTLSYYS